MHNETLFKINIASLIISLIYDKIIKYDLIDMGDSLECQEYIDKLSQCIKVEQDLYRHATKEDVSTYFNLIKGIRRFDSTKDSRIYNRMNDKKRMNEKQHMVDTVLLSSIISSKLIIDVIKGVDYKINNLKTNDEVDNYDIYILKLYNKRMKYHYLGSNDFIESLAIKYNFNINEIPSYDFKAIEDRCGFKFLDAIKSILLNYVMDSIRELADLKIDDKYLLLYTSLFEISRVEAILPYLDEEAIDKVILMYTNYKYSYDSNSALRKVKKIIYKRKEEFK